MCTLSWLQDRERFELFFNRDERRTRKPALPPERRFHAGTRFLAPLDGDFGGSWIGVNEFGLLLCLLNGDSPRDRDDDEPPAGFTSRGLLLTALIDSRSADQTVRRLARLEHSRFRSFVLAAFEPPEAAALARWDRSDLRVTSGGLDVVPTPLISSSFCSEEVRCSRVRLFERMRRAAGEESPSVHLDFHASHEPQKGPYSVCMHRTDARTVSFSRIVVGPESIRFHYSPHPPCRGVADASFVSLPLSPARPGRAGSPRHG